ncbi:hypothetical protein A3J61_01765 [Candidatus Nomurabacteria bacterium RIFCSPHIGHO2_02_FULL_38_15]|uniref:EfeO-type cupredoxin-like domain-containing protein n=1 Tax=Candidatus Nomurabacteria bacterium RIFCSPHIGHO2_02_FULL_38_15 TaxID=1801752 RepID=A0A1F6VQN3_9BACT|nr:MAG: hypothetical protein A3J61_01765 [Candidatus Nomurabacteria bacterium RIFCSPHIGHO2_02_FULL_38_15]
MNKNSSVIILIIVLIVGLSVVLLVSSKSKNKLNEPVQNVEVRDGVQYVTINAKGGYSPQVSNARAGIPTKLIVKTNGTFDCSSALVIRQLNFQKILSQTGEEIIDLGIPKAGEPLQGLCSMGMYSFLINF